ncbi:hypothetical protein CRENBAI_026881 [Crenichthys baileyi]|uniref:Uncharacterized protein n=1 Tax=Crenichthys baileyi TaxID=28760 RepID=A0AAV9RHB5_9TELE
MLSLDCDDGPDPMKYSEPYGFVSTAPGSASSLRCFCFLPASVSPTAVGQLSVQSEPRVQRDTPTLLFTPSRFQPWIVLEKLDLKVLFNPSDLLEPVKPSL